MSSFSFGVINCWKEQVAEWGEALATNSETADSRTASSGCLVL